jgi:hypothetical protein
MPIPAIAAAAATIAALLPLIEQVQGIIQRASGGAEPTPDEHEALERLQAIADAELDSALARRRKHIQQQREGGH